MKNFPQTIVSAQWLAENLMNPALVVLDASMPKAGSKEPLPLVRIKGARRIDIKKEFSDQNSSLPNTMLSPEAFEKAAQNLGINQNSLIVVYDYLGIYSAPRVWWMFKAMGHQNIAVLNGGLVKWKAEGFECESIIAGEQYAKGDFVAKAQPDLILNTRDVLALYKQEDTQILDARSSGRFHGTTPEPRADLRSGHIPNSLNLPYTELLDNGEIKSAKELQALFGELNIRNKKLVFSCGSGITACVLALGADIAGLPQHKAVYDGSWTAWGADESLADV